MEQIGSVFTTPVPLSDSGWAGYLKNFGSAKCVAESGNFSELQIFQMDSASVCEKEWNKHG